MSLLDQLFYITGAIFWGIIAVSFFCLLLLHVIEVLKIYVMWAKCPFSSFKPHVSFLRKIWIVVLYPHAWAWTGRPSFKCSKNGTEYSLKGETIIKATPIKPNKKSDKKKISIPMKEMSFRYVGKYVREEGDYYSKGMLDSAIYYFDGTDQDDLEYEIYEPWTNGPKRTRIKINTNPKKKDDVD